MVSMIHGFFVPSNTDGSVENRLNRSLHMSEVAVVLHPWCPCVFSVSCKTLPTMTLSEQAIVFRSIPTS